jgi:hypothetical protein
MSYENQIFTRVWEMVGNQLRRGYPSTAIEQAAERAHFRARLGTERYIVFQAIHFLINAAVSLMEMELRLCY